MKKTLVFCNSSSFWFMRIFFDGRHYPSFLLLGMNIIHNFAGASAHKLSQVCARCTRPFLWYRYKRAIDYLLASGRFGEPLEMYSELLTSTVNIHKSMGVPVSC